MKKSAVLLAVAGLATAASAQTFVIYSLSGVNLTDAGRGTDNADAGDIIRLRLNVEHDGLSFAGGKVDISYTGVGDDEDVNLFEDAFAFPFDPWVVGRSPITRILVSDGHISSTQPHNEDVNAIGGTITDANNDFWDFASTPPGLGGLGGAFPIASGDATVVFEYTYDGGVDTWDPKTNGEARLWRTTDDINGAVVDARNGDTLVISPAPASLALLGLGGLVVGRRRR